MKCRSCYPAIVISMFILFAGCNKDGDEDDLPDPVALSLKTISVNGSSGGTTFYNVNRTPLIRFSFTSPVNRGSVSGSVVFRSKTGTAINYSANYENSDSTIVIQPATQLEYLSKYQVSVSTTLQSSTGGNLQSAINVNLTTQIDSSRKFPQLSDNALLDLVQQQTFQILLGFWSSCKWTCKRKKYFRRFGYIRWFRFWNYGNYSGIHRGFITRAQGLGKIANNGGVFKKYRSEISWCISALAEWCNRCCYSF